MRKFVKGTKIKYTRKYIDAFQKKYGRLPKRTMMTKTGGGKEIYTKFSKVDWKFLKGVKKTSRLALGITKKKETQKALSEERRSVYKKEGYKSKYGKCVTTCTCVANPHIVVPHMRKIRGKMVKINQFLRRRKSCRK